jgi:dihydrofolate reductase
MISAIVAVAKNGVIGKSNSLPWYLPADLNYFRSITRGCDVIMGKVTFDSIVKKLGHGLPGRTNIVLTRDATYTSEFAKVVTSLDDAIAATSTDQVFIIGGSQIYDLARDLIQRWYVTEVDAEIDGDVILRGFDKSQFREAARQSHLADDENQYNYDFVTYERK